MSRRRYSNRKIYLLFGGAFTLLIIVAILHDIGYLLFTGIVGVIAYAFGRRSMMTTATRHTRKLTTNARYGQARGYRGGSLPRKPVETGDAVSAYPSTLTDPETGEPAQTLSEPGWHNPKPGVWRREDFGPEPAEPATRTKPEPPADNVRQIRRLTDTPMSGVRKLFGEDETDDD